MGRSRSLLLLMLWMAIGCAGERLPTELDTALDGATSITVYSLDPKQEREKAKERFESWEELGSTVITEPQQRLQLVDALRNAVAEHDGVVANCFDPRHRLHLDWNGHRYDVVVCFHCYQLEWYRDGERQPIVLISRGAQGLLDDILRKADVPLPAAAK